MCTSLFLNAINDLDRINNNLFQNIQYHIFLNLNSLAISILNLITANLIR